MPCPAPVVGDKSLKTQSQVSFMSVEAMEMDPAPAPDSVTSPVKRNHKLRQHYESSPSQILSSLQTVLSVSLLGSETGGPTGVISCKPVVE